ncbi:hypothetical protein [Liquorilactobacillus hordei]|uniref:hypothetical protein n=1 Tax=Liquorilactobacillus hordei TaxID=468911 RepID=UPI001CBDE64D|nr:hypothetical protein [Liquorilactobacillus hordei]
MAQTFLQNYKISVVGQSVNEQIPVLTNQITFLRQEEWVLDNAYVRILLNQGLVFFICFFSYLVYKISRNRYSIMTASSIISVFALAYFERYAFNILLFPIFFLMISGDLEGENESKA